MRIAIYENLPRGGAKRAAYELGRHLAANHELYLYRLSTSPSGPPDLSTLAREEYSFRFSPLRGALDSRLARGKVTPRSYVVFGPLMRLHRQIAKHIDSHRYDVVLAHPDVYSQAPHLLRYVQGVPTVYFCQEPLRILQEKLNLSEYRSGLRALPFGRWREGEEMIALHRIAHHDRLNARSATALAVNSVHSRERVWAAYGRTATICHLGINTQEFTPTSHAPKRRFEVLSVGMPSVIKGHDLIIEALARIPKARRPAHRIVMPWPLNATGFERLAKERGVELIVEASIDDDAMLDRFRRAVATVCAARLEPFGLTPLESMACGTPVVAIREGGYRDTVRDGEGGFLVDPDPAAIAVAIDALAQDPVMVDNLGRGGREYVMRCWPWRIGGEALERLLESVAASSVPTGGLAFAAGTG